MCLFDWTSSFLSLRSLVAILQSSPAGQLLFPQRCALTTSEQEHLFWRTLPFRFFPLSKVSSCNFFLTISSRSCYCRKNVFLCLCIAFLTLACLSTRIQRFQHHVCAPCGFVTARGLYLTVSFYSFRMNRQSEWWLGFLSSTWCPLFCVSSIFPRFCVHRTVPYAVIRHGAIPPLYTFPFYAKLAVYILSPGRESLSATNYCRGILWLG